MSAFDDLNIAALGETLNTIGEVIQYKAKNLTGVVSGVSITEELQDGGILQKRGVKIVIVKDASIDGASLPKVGEKLFYAAKGYRVLSIDEDAYSYELTCDTDAR